jgi:hypothetical protein
VALFAADAHIGTWQLNLAKSKYSPGPAPKSLTVTMEQDGEKVRQIVKGIDGEGKPIDLTASRLLDGKDGPAIGTLYGADTLAVKRINDHTTEAVYKKDGKVLVTSRSVVSKDGKTRTVTAKGVNASGAKVNNVAVYDRK